MTPAARGAVALTLHGARFDLRALLRNPRARFFALVFPLVLLVALASIAGTSTVKTGGQKIELKAFYVPAIVTVALVTSCFGSLVQAVVNRRATGVLKRRRAAGAPALSLVVGQSMANAGLALVVSSVLLLVGKAGYGVGLSAGALAAVAITVLLTALCFCAVAFALASIIPSPDSVQPISQAVTFPLFFISGIWFPEDGLPKGLQDVADAFPIAHASQALHQAFAHDAFSAAVAPGHLAVLAAWAVAAAVVAARRFEWLPYRTGG